MASDIHGKTLVLKGTVINKLEDIAFKPLIDNEKNEEFIFFKRLRLVEESPVNYEHIYISNGNLPNFIKEPLLEGSLFRTLIIKYQIDVHSMIHEVRAVTADKETSNLIKIKQK